MKINLYKIANPYMLFGMAWTICLILYAIGWSNLFPPISNKLMLFLTVIIVIFFTLSRYFNKIKIITNAIGTSEIKLIENIFKLNVILWLANFAYSGVPFLSGIRNDNFGIPTLVVLATSINGFLCLSFFYFYLITNKKKYLFYVAGCLSIYVLVISRGGIMMNGCSMFFLWVIFKKKLITVKRLGGIISGILIIFYLFGVAGNYRTIKDIASYSTTFDSRYNSDVILAIGEASDSFRNSPVPDEFFWSYLYITSPLSNLQYNLNQISPDLTIENVLLLINNEILFDSLSKRIDALFNTERKQAYLIVSALTVCTTLAISYLYAGWVGMIIFLIFFAALPLFYIILIKKNPFGIIGLSVLCTIYFFSIFDNMLTITALILQIFYPMLIVFFNRIKLKRTNDFKAA